MNFSNEDNSTELKAERSRKNLREIKQQSSRRSSLKVSFSRQGAALHGCRDCRPPGAGSPLSHLVLAEFAWEEGSRWRGGHQVAIQV